MRADLDEEYGYESDVAYVREKKKEKRVETITQIVDKFVGALTVIVENDVRRRVLAFVDPPKNGHAVKKPKPPVQAKAHGDANDNGEALRMKWRKAWKKRQKRLKMKGKAAK